MKKLIFIVGPTAAGKTQWAHIWASQAPSCILNSDSLQAYTDLNIGSAKPDFTKYPSITYHLFDIIKAPNLWTAGDFRKSALPILKTEITHKHIFIVGGSGFYIQALERGMYPVNPARQNTLNKFEQQLKTQGLAHLYQILQKQDPKTACLIHAKDQYRILRALSIMHDENRTLSTIKKQFKKQKLPYPYIKIGLHISKEDLIQRVRLRTQNMLKQGLLEEVEALLKQNLSAWQALNSVGYKEVVSCLKGDIKKTDLEDVIVTKTMALAKKQKTWFKKDKSILWFNYNENALKVYNKIFKC